MNRLRERTPVYLAFTRAFIWGALRLTAAGNTHGVRTKILHLVGVLVASLIVISSPFNLFPKAQAAESVAHLSFPGSGVQTDSQRFNNFVQIGEETIAFPDADIMEYSPGSVDIDLEKFTDRPLTLTVVAGTRDDGNPVTDSMTLRDIKLVLPSGEALYATGTVANQSYAFRDSGSNRYDFTFEIPVPAQNDVEASLTVPASPLSGMVEILAATNSGNSVTVTAGGQELVGEATGAKFVFEGAGIQTVQNNFNNRIIVGDTEIPMPDRDILKWETAEIAIPANLLSNDLVVTVAAGGTKNHDDFEVRNVRLVLADGTELRDPNYGESDVAELTDGCCPNPEVTAVTQVPFHFELSDAQLAIQRFTWDTTSVVDGDHTIQLSTTDASGQPVFREENVTVVNGNDGEPGDVSVEPALTVPGSPVAGSIDITAISGDGKTMRVTAGGTELSGETAPVQFVFEGSGIQTKSQKFNNRIIVGDEVFPMPDRDVNGWETVEMDIPGELLANEFTVTVAAGGAANHDDFSVRNMHLKMSDGILLWAKDYPEGTRVELLDGCCPDPNVTAVTEVPFTFDLTDTQLAIQRFK